MNESDMQKRDTSHEWVWNLKKGDKVWIAIEENITQTERFCIDVFEQIGPSEYMGIEEIFVPYEMEVVNNWVMKSGNEESHILAFEFTSPKKYGRLKFATQNKTRDLLNLFGRETSDSVVSTRTFKTEDECKDFCRQYICMHYTVSQCDYIVESLTKMIQRVKEIKAICETETFSDKSGRTIKCE